MFYLTEALFYGIPLAAFVFFIVCLVQYRTAKKKNSEAPGTFTEAQMKVRKWLLIIASVIAGVLLLVVIAFIVLLFLAIAFM